MAGRLPYLLGLQGENNLEACRYLPIMLEDTVRLWLNSLERKRHKKGIKLENPIKSYSRLLAMNGQGFAQGRMQATRLGPAHS